MTPTTTPFAPTYGALCFDVLDRKLVRFKNWTWDGFAVVMDRNTRKELPDYRHPTQVLPPRAAWTK